AGRRRAGAGRSRAGPGGRLAPARTRTAPSVSRGPGLRRGRVGARPGVGVPAGDGRGLVLPRHQPGDEPNGPPHPEPPDALTLETGVRYGGRGFPRSAARAGRVPPGLVGCLVDLGNGRALWRTPVSKVSGEAVGSEWGSEVVAEHGDATVAQAEDLDQRHRHRT